LASSLPSHLRSLVVPRRDVPLPLYGDVLRLEVVEHAVVTTFATDPALLRAAEGGRGIADKAPVQTDHAKLQRLTDAQATCQVAGVDVADEPMLGSVGQGDGLRLVVEGHDGSDRAEELLSQDGRARLDVHQHGRLVEETVASRALPTDQRLGPVQDRCTDQSIHLGDRVLVDEWTDIGALL